ncbi:MAG: c-type cytochrome [Steroidobacteraceae bacterium]
MTEREQVGMQKTRAGLRKRPLQFVVSSAIAAVAIAASLNARAADETRAQDLAKSSGCFKCHAIEKKKDGRPYRDVAAKFAGIANAEDKLIFHITSGEKVKFPDGHEENHKKVKSTDTKEIRNLVQWILSLPGGTKY